MIYLSTTIWLTPGGSSTIHIYTQKVHRTTQKTVVWAVPHLCEFYPDICLTTEEKTLRKKKFVTEAGQEKPKKKKRKINNKKEKKRKNQNLLDLSTPDSAVPH